MSPPRGLTALRFEAWQFWRAGCFGAHRMAHVFRGLIAWILLGVVLQATAAPAPKEPAPGTTADAVIRTHGRPKGQITTGTREIWTYDRFRVMFEHGRVLNVSPIERSRPESTVLAPIAPPVSAPPPASATGVPVVSAKTPAPPAAAPVGTSTREPAAKAPVRAPHPPRSTRSSTGGIMRLALFVMFIALGVAIGVVVWAHSKARTLEDEATAQKLAARERRRQSD